VILVAGGGGRLGTHVVRGLASLGLPVRVLTRDPARCGHLRSDGVEVVTGDVRDRASLAQAIQGVHTVISAVQGFAGPGDVSPRSVDRDGNFNLVEAAAGAGAAVVLMSVVGASADHPMELFRMKYAAEQQLRTSGVPWTIVRATAFVELWIELLRQTATRSGRPLVFGRGDNPVNFVSVTDVAVVVERAATDSSTRGSILEVGGPENVTFNQLAALVQDPARAARGPRHIPRPMLRAMSVALAPLKPALARQVRSALILDSDDFAFDATMIHQRFPDLVPTAVANVLATSPRNPGA